MLEGTAAIDMSSDALSRPLSGSSDVATTLKKIFQLIKEHNNESVSLGWRMLLKQELYEIAAQCDTEGWDDEDAIAISDFTVEAAELLIDLLPDNVIEPEIYPEETGDIAFDWRIGEDIIFSISASEDSFIYAGIFGGKKSRGTVLLFEELPFELMDPIKKYLQKD